MCTCRDVAPQCRLAQRICLSIWFISTNRETTDTALTALTGAITTCPVITFMWNYDYSSAKCGGVVYCWGRCIKLQKTMLLYVYICSLHVRPWRSFSACLCVWSCSTGAHTITHQVTLSALIAVVCTFIAVSTQLKHVKSLLEAVRSFSIYDVSLESMTVWVLSINQQPQFAFILNFCVFFASDPWEWNPCHLSWFPVFLSFKIIRNADVSHHHINLSSKAAL